MKKLLVILVMILGFGYVASAQYFVQGGVSVESHVFKQDVKIGKKIGNDQFALSAEFSNPTHQDNETIYFAGVEYARYFRNNLFATGEAKIQLNSDTYGIVVAPGVGYNIQVADYLSVQPSVSFPFGSGATVGKNVPVKAGVGVQLMF